MTLDDFLNHIEAGGALNTPEIYRLMDEMSDEARRVTCEINNSYHSQEELRAFMSRLTGKPVDVTRNFAASLFRNIKYFTLRKLYLCRKWMQKRLQKTTTTGITLPNFDFLA